MAIMAEEETPVVDETVEQDPSMKAAETYTYEWVWQLEDGTVISSCSCEFDPYEISSEWIEYYNLYWPDGYEDVSYKEEQTETGYKYVYTMQKMESQTYTVTYYVYDSVDDYNDYYYEPEILKTITITSDSDHIYIDAYNSIPAGYKYLSESYDYDETNDCESYSFYVAKEEVQQELIKEAEDYEEIYSWDVYYAEYGDNTVTFIKGPVAIDATYYTFIDEIVKNVPSEYKLVYYSNYGYYENEYYAPYYAVDNGSTVTRPSYNYSINYIIAKVERDSNSDDLNGNSNNGANSQSGNNGGKKAVVNTGVEYVADYSFTYVTMAGASLLAALKSRK